MVQSEIFYHGTYRLFDHFQLNHLGEGEGKSQFGHGIYITSNYATAALYAAKAGKSNGCDTFYVYTVEVPVLTDENHLFSCKPVTAEVVSRIEKALGEYIPEEAKSRGKFFRKYVGNILTNQRGTVKQMTSKADDAAEDAAAEFLNDNGVIYLAYPYAQTKPDGDTNRAVLNGECIRILKIEQVDVNDKNKLIEDSERVIEWQ
jgi:hypothetical protein